MKQRNSKKYVKKIWYDLFSRKEVEWTSQSDWAIYTVFVDKDVREIIFTQEFMNKYEFYIMENISKEINLFYAMLCWSLKDPTDYLYNLLFNWEEKWN